MRTSSSLPNRVAATLLAASSLLALLGLTGAAHAASPVPSPSPSPPVLETQAWLDEALPADATPGTRLTVGALLWDPERDVPVPAPTTFVRLYPATGGGAPVESPASQDWIGHVVATVAVPDGGVGRLEIGVQGSSCDADGCHRSDALYALPGVGPPEGAPLPQIADADIEPLLPTQIVGEPGAVEIVLRPKVDWPDFAMPDRLVLRVRQPRGEALAVEPAALADVTTGRYEATVTLPEEGQYILEAAMTEGASPAEVFGGSAVTINAIPPLEVSPGPTTPGTGEDGDGSGLLLAGIAAVAVLVAGGVIFLGVRSRP